MKIILSECISERLFFELLAKMSSYKIDRVFVYHKGNRTHDKRNTFPRRYGLPGNEQSE